MANWIIPKDAARELVASGVKKTGKTTQTVKKAAPIAEDAFALVSITGNWTAVAGGVGYSTSGVIINAAGVATSGTITVYAPFATSETASELPKRKVHAARVNGRWEMIQGGGGGDTFQALPMRLQSSWTQSNGIWRATASPIVSDDGAVDTSTVYSVFVPTATSKPAGEPLAWRFWAVYRNERWESIQQEIGNGETYVAGTGIDIGAENAQLGGRPITNTGVLAVRISGSNYEAKGEPFNLSSSHFLWRASTLSGEMEAWIKTHRVSVVTDIQNGVPVKKTIEVIGAE